MNQHGQMNDIRQIDVLTCDSEYSQVPVSAAYGHLESASFGRMMVEDGRHAAVQDVAYAGRLKKLKMWSRLPKIVRCLV